MAHKDAETIRRVREYILSRQDIESRNTWIGGRQYSLRELADEVQKQSPDGIRVIELWEQHYSRTTRS